MNNTLKNNIKKLEKESGLKRSVIVKGLKIAPSTYQNWLAGLCDPKLVDIEKMSIFYTKQLNRKVSKSDILGD